MFIHFPHSKCHFGAIIRLYPYFRHGHVGRKPWPSEHSDLVPKEPPLRSGSQGHKARLASPLNGHLGAANHQTKWWKVMKMQNDQKLIRMSLGPLLIKLFWYGQNVDKALDRKSSASDGHALFGQSGPLRCPGSVCTVCWLRALRSTTSPELHPRENRCI